MAAGLDQNLALMPLVGWPLHMQDGGHVKFTRLVV